MVDLASLIKNHLELKEQNGGKYKFTLTVPVAHPFFKGHFPELPVLPAVGIVDLTLLVMEQAVQQKFMISGIEMAKFIHPITPGLKVELELEHEVAQTWKVQWKDLQTQMILANLKLMV